MIGAECCFPLIALNKADVIIPPPYVELGKVLGCLQLVDKLGDKWKRVAVFDCDRIQLPVILYRAQSTILLFNKEEWRCKRGFGRANPAGLKVLFEESVELLLFVG